MSNGYCRLLVVSNEGISQNSSNGRTLRNFLLDWPKDCLAQFYINKSKLDYSVCDNYYQVSDKMVINAFVRKKSEQEKKSNDNSSMRTKHGRNALTMLLRNLAWSSNRWDVNDFYSWVRNFKPDVILLQAGDSAFMFQIARRLSEKFDAALVIYNTENFYFKKYDYLRSIGFAHMLYPIFRKQFCSEVAKAVKQAEITIYNSIPLQQDYDREFHRPSTVLYTVTEMEISKEEKTKSKDILQISYLGNLGLNRHRALIEIANTFHDISCDLFVDIYGSSPDQKVIEELNSCESIRYKGVVPYEEVINIMYNSDILVHAESFEPFYREGLKRAFSTKIADCLASGKCFILYAPAELACAQYLLYENAAFVISNLSELRREIEKIASDTKYREKYTERALALVEKNHRINGSSVKFKKIIMDAFSTYNTKRGDNV